MIDEKGELLTNVIPNKGFSGKLTVKLSNVH